MKVVIETIPHQQQRYNTVGDWWWEDEGQTLQLRVSETGDWRASMAVAYHELFEALACKQSGITQESVDAFDMTWKPHEGYEEPGDDPQAPYFSQHQMALTTETCLMAMVGLGMADYQKLLGQFKRPKSGA